MADNRGRDGGFRGANRNTDRKPRGDKPGFGEKKFGEKKFGDKKPYGERKFGDKPGFGEKKFGEKKFGDKKPYGERKFGDKPGFGEKKFGEKKFGDKKPYGERKFGDKPSFGEKKFGDRKPAFGAPRAERKPRPVNLAPRRVALETLLDVSRSDAYASLALDKRLAQANLPRRDRAFVTQLVYGTLENRMTLDWRIDQFLEGNKEIDQTVREILRMGAYQLFYLDRVPDMAAVDESVSLTRAMGLEALTGLVNGVLRNMIRGKNDVVWPKPQDDAVKYLSVMFSAPTALCQMLVSAYGEHDAMEILRYRPKDRSVTVRVNYLRCDDARLRSLFADDELEFDPGILPGMYKVHSAGDMTRMRAFQNGLFTIQGESSVLAARMVGAKPGQTVLDACAAPGGKTAVLSEMMGDTGRVYAWDTHAHRVELIRGTMNRLKLENVRPAVKRCVRSARGYGHDAGCGAGGRALLRHGRDERKAGREIPRDGGGRAGALPHPEGYPRRDCPDGEGGRHAGVFHLLDSAARKTRSRFGRSSNAIRNTRFSRMGAELPEKLRGASKTPSVCRCSRTGTARTASTSAACAG